MIKSALAIIALLTLFGCKTSKLNDYYGQPLPGNTPVIFAPDEVSKQGRLEHGISFSPNTNELAFGVLDKNEAGIIYFSKKENNNWSKPNVFEPLKNESAYLPYFTPDGKSLVYAQSIPDPNYITNIWTLSKVNDTWGNAKKLQAPINTDSREANASITSDGTIYFSSNRNCEGIKNCFTADLFYADLKGNTYESANPLANLNTGFDEESIFISPKEDYVIFCRNRNTATGADLFIAYQNKNKEWTLPEILDSNINSEFWDRRPFISSDNKFLFFTRLNIENFTFIESDIYWVNTTRVFKPFVFNPLTDNTVTTGENFEFQIPTDYFNDIDGNLKVSIKTNYNWMKFDDKTMTLSGLPPSEGEFELIIYAIDANKNRTDDTFKLVVKN